MENSVFLSYGAFISPLGNTVSENHFALSAGKTGVQLAEKAGFNDENWYISTIPHLENNRYDDLLTKAVLQLKKEYPSQVLSDEKTRFIISSTKGNIDALPEDVFASTHVLIRDLTGNPNESIVVSNACISGVIALNVAADYLRYSEYQTIIVIGIDIVSDFVLYGFQSLFALSNLPVLPFDKDRKGISLGEACGIIVATSEKPAHFSVEYINGASSNDANHISGPSRTGEGLVRVVNQTLEKSKCASSEIDYISAHGTGTLYNDEMESIAFSRTALQNTPINSLKGYYGHTLGAAGVIETLVGMLSIEHQQLFACKGFSEQGTSEKLALISETKPAKIETVLKTASGFGGGNAAFILKK